MAETSPDALVVHVETLIEAGELAAARRAIADAEGRLGPQPVLAELRERIDEVEQIAGRPEIDAILRRVREEISRANYPAAVDALKQAVGLSPRDPELRQMMEQTVKAALRHEAAVERNRAVAQTAEHIEELLARSELDAARQELADAGRKFGRHNTLLALWETLEELDQEAELERTVVRVSRVRALIDAENWRGALQEAERTLKRDPGNVEALELREQARAELEREEAQRQQAGEIEKARQDVERLIAARELPRASQRLAQAIDVLGEGEVFTALGKRIDTAKAELQASRVREWTERRTREAEDLVRQAGRLQLQGNYEEAIARLQAARELDPRHAEVEGMLTAATAARERQFAERRRTEAVAAHQVAIRSLLEGLELDAAEARLRAAEQELDPRPFAALRTRLTHLREARSAGAALPASGAELDGHAAAAHAGQQAFRAAYSWQQTVLFPFRGPAQPWFWAVFAFLLLLEILDGVPVAGVGFLVLRLLAPLALAGLVLGIVRATVGGATQLPSWGELGRHWVGDLGLWLGIAVAAFLPLALLVTSGAWHRLLGAESGPLGWLVAAVLGWFAAAVIVLACGATAFGNRQAWRLPRHLKALLIAESDLLLAVDVVFGLGVAIAVLRGTLASYVPWIGAPLAVALELWGLVAVPHLIGVVVRRNHLELAGVYSP